MSTFPFDLDPSDKIIFSSPKLGDEACSVILKVTNNTKEAQAFKIKCTNNDFFRLRPPTINIPPGDKPINVNITFNPGKQVPENGRHYFAVYGTPYKNAENVKAAFATDEGKKVEPKRMYAYFNKEGNDEKKDEKKEEKKDEKKEDEKKDEKKEEKKDEKKEEKKDEKKEEKKDEKKDEKKEEQKDEKKDDEKKK